GRPAAAIWASGSCYDDPATLPVVPLRGQRPAHDVVRDLVDLATRVHRTLLEEPPRVRLGETVLVHQPSLGAVDDLACLQPLGQGGVLPFACSDLAGAAGRRPDRRVQGARLGGRDETRGG